MTKPPAEPPCPICGKPRSDRHRPFCSPRCADADLGRWLSDAYVIPLPPDFDEDGAAESTMVAGQRGRPQL